MKMTKAQFAQQCAYIAKNASAWAGDTLTLPEYFNDPESAQTVSRFTDQMRGHLDLLDKWAGRSTLAQRGD